MGTKNDSEKNKHTCDMYITGVPKPLRAEFKRIVKEEMGQTEAGVVKNLIKEFVQTKNSKAPSV